MTQESFSKAMLRYLEEQLQRYPAMQQQDIVKFVFQAMLGAGHLVSSRDAVTEYAAREMALLPADPGETLYEMLSPSWCRLNLRAAKARAFTPSVIAGLMSSPGKTVPFTRQDVYTFCKEFTAGKLLIRDPALLNRENGGYVEGFTYITCVSQSEDGAIQDVEHSIPLLGY